MSRRGSADERAAASLRALFLLVTTVLLVSLAGVALGFHSLVVSTGAAARAVECCGTLFSPCLVSPSMARATLPWIGMVILLFGILRAVANAWRHVRHDAAFLGALAAVPPCESTSLAAAVRELKLTGHVLLLPNCTAPRAFTAGLRRPRIYVSDGLVANLSQAELRAVLLHEEHHRRCRDPLRSFLAHALRDLVFFLPVGRSLRQTFCDMREDAADDASAARGSDALDLANALCRLARFRVRHSDGSSLAGIRGTGELRRRIERLVGAAEPTAARRHPFRLVLSLLIVGLLVGSLYLPVILGGSPAVFVGCDPETCAAMGCGR